MRSWRAGRERRRSCGRCHSLRRHELGYPLSCGDSDVVSEPGEGSGHTVSTDPSGRVRRFSRKRPLPQGEDWLSGCKRLDLSACVQPLRFAAYPFQIMESTSIDFISFWPTASSMLALRLCTLKSLTKIGRLISAPSSGRTLVNFETKSSRSAFGASAINFCARVNTARKRLAASPLALSQLSLANIAVMSMFGMFSWYG